MTKQDLQGLFDEIRDNNDYGNRAYRVAELVAPQVGVVAPVDDTDLALFAGQDYIDTVTGKKYYATAVTVTTTTWNEVALAV